MLIVRKLKVTFPSFFFFSHLLLRVKEEAGNELTGTLTLEQMIFDIIVLGPGKGAQPRFVHMSLVSGAHSAVPCLHPLTCLLSRQTAASPAGGHLMSFRWANTSLSKGLMSADVRATVLDSLKPVVAVLEGLG